MKVVILAGGLGTRISEESFLKPKPMIEIGEKPIIWHIMKLFSFYGFKEFIICCGYKGYSIKEYFINYLLHNSSIELNLTNNSYKILDPHSEDWKVTLVDTGVETQTGGRLKKIKHLVGSDDFFMTYGDGVSNVNLHKLLEFHKSHKKLSTITAVQPPGRFGALEIENNSVKSFSEKPIGDGGWINGGYFVLSPNVLNYINNDFTIWEREPLQNLAKNNNLMAFHHKGFWHPMDTLRDKNYLESLWSQSKALWKVW